MDVELAELQIVWIHCCESLNAKDTCMWMSDSTHEIMLAASMLCGHTMYPKIFNTVIFMYIDNAMPFGHVEAGVIKQQEKIVYDKININQR